jgi:hypothetical protein
MVTHWSMPPRDTNRASSTRRSTLPRAETHPADIADAQSQAHIVTIRALADLFAIRIVID